MPMLRPAIEQFMGEVACETEAILVNDGSQDRTVELIAHCSVQVSLNSTAPVARYFFVRHEGGVAVALISGVSGAIFPLAWPMMVSSFRFADETLPT